MLKNIYFLLFIWYNYLIIEVMISIVFEFRILGLFLLFFLVSLYVFTYDKKNKHGIFSLALFGCYGLEFLYLVCYIARQKEFYSSVFLNIYYICLGLVILF